MIYCNGMLLPTCGHETTTKILKITTEIQKQPQTDADIPQSDYSATSKGCKMTTKKCKTISQSANRHKNKYKEMTDYREKQKTTTKTQQPQPYTKNKRKKNQKQLKGDAGIRQVPTDPLQRDTKTTTKRLKMNSQRCKINTKTQNSYKEIRKQLQRDQN